MRATQNLLFRLFRKFDILILFLYSSVIFSLSTQSGPAPSFISFPHADKLFHAAEFGVLGYLWFHTLSRAGLNGRAMKAPILSLIICLIYAVAVESLQTLVPNRTPSMGDVLADGVGAALAIGIGRTVILRWGKRAKLSRRAAL